MRVPMTSMNIMNAEGLRCEDLFECFYNLNDLDKKVYFVLAESRTPMTNDEIARIVEKDKTAVYRSLQKLLTCGLITKSKKTYQRRPSYNYLYQAVDISLVKNRLRQDLKNWFIRAEHLIDSLDELFDSGK
ncbi:MAG: helix-turn-helix domain-containing protein [Thermoplasmata archaeon]|nr:helix-turn-helix domain-containing protein [Thermoplasmata archaeon]